MQWFGNRKSTEGTERKILLGIRQQEHREKSG